MGGAKDKNWLTDTGVCGVLAATVFVLYRKILDLWWMYDDAYLIRMLRSTTLAATLHDRAFYAQLGRPIFNPLLMVSWKLDLQRFGLNTRALYFHQLIALAVLSVLLYALFRLWSSRVASAAAAVVFLIAGPTLVVEPELMLRHYIEGAVFATAAVIAFVLALRRDSWCLAITSAPGSCSFASQAHVCLRSWGSSPSSLLLFPWPVRCRLDGHLRLGFLRSCRSRSCRLRFLAAAVP